MKTKLLKKLRKKAHDKFRIVPEKTILSDNRNWCIEELNDGNLEWRAIYNYLTLDEAKAIISDERYCKFKSLANRLINERKRKKMFKQAQNL